MQLAIRLAKLIHTQSKKSVKYVPPPEDIAALLKVAKQGFEHDFLICLLHTAARISEIRLLAWEDVDLARRILTLWPSKEITDAVIG